jgi:hypothetical protein
MRWLKVPVGEFGLECWLRGLFHGRPMMRGVPGAARKFMAAPLVIVQVDALMMITALYVLFVSKLLVPFGAG